MDFRRLAKTMNLLVWTIRSLASIEAVDALFYLGDAGWFGAHPIVTMLVAGAVVGAALTWVRRPIPVAGIGGFLVAIAPSSLYPLSGLLVIASLGVIALTRVRIRTSTPESMGPANPT